MDGKIFDIKRFAVHDGDGIRTTVFFKGCPLKCVWCHNPEGIDFKPQLAFYKNKCCSCGRCVSVCPQKAHKIENCAHDFDRESCVSCGTCQEVCPNDALKLYGRNISVSELIPILLEDKDFYDNSGGGVTLSGGECLLQADFCGELLKKLKECGVNTAVDTCGFVPREAFDKVIPYTDIFLYDIKAVDISVHLMCTGQDNQKILDNLKYLDEKGCKIEIRIPYVPRYNSGEMERISTFLKELNNISKIRLLPYHNYAGTKYEALGMENTLPDKLPKDEKLEAARKILEQSGFKVCN